MSSVIHFLKSNSYKENLPGGCVELRGPEAGLGQQKKDSVSSSSRWKILDGEAWEDFSWPAVTTTVSVLLLWSRKREEL